MELLSAGSVSFPAPPRTIGRALGLSAAVHAGLAIALLFLPARAARLDAPIEIAVDVLVEQPHPVEAATPPPIIEPAVAPVAVRPAPVLRPTPSPRAAAEPASRPAVAASPLEAAAPASPEPADSLDPAPVAVSAAAALGLAAGATSGAGTVQGGVGIGAGGPPVGATAGARRASTDRYRDQMLRTRIGAVFRYPHEARELELAGRVLVAVSIHRDGRLLDAKLVGRCPHAILCADGLRTIRAAAPFPPVPAELGPSIVIEVPLTYSFE